MKSSELHKLIKRNGWVHIRTKGSHYIYEKEGRREAVPYHGSKEAAEGLRKSLIKKMELK
jgi:mRNA interferase HicA